MKALKGNRTRIVNILASVPAVIAAAQTLQGVPEFQQVLPPSVWPWYVVGVTVANLALRQITTTPPGKKL